VVALHVHHGLSPNADQWGAFCRKASARLGVEFELLRIRVKRHGGESLEGNARSARYGALTELCGKWGIAVLATAHHADDQAETLLLNLSRGTGLAGLQGVAAQRRLGATLLVRPFLAFSAAEIRRTLTERGIAWVEDESNENEELRRNALRHRILPALEEIFPGAALHLAKTAQLVAQAQQLLDERGLEDLALLNADTEGFTITGLKELSPERTVNLLRTWFRHYRTHAPAARVIEALALQLRDSKPHPHIELQYEGERFVVWKKRFTAAAPAPPMPPPPPYTFRWTGQDVLELPGWHGNLRFVRSPELGVPEEWLRSVELVARARSGGERLRLAPGGRMRTLKNLYQESEIAVIERESLPLVFADGTLLFAAGLGAEVTRLVRNTPNAIALVWEPTVLDAVDRGPCATSQS
jgi:tRNA(Ile)-lysidine synthase